MFVALVALALKLPSGGHPVVHVTPADFASAEEPQMVVNATGDVFIAFGQENAIYCSISKDGGRSYAAPVKVAEAGQLSLGMRRGPRIVAGSGFVSITAVYGRKGMGQDGDLLAWRSTDGGLTWKGPARVNDHEGSAREGLHGMALSPAGALACAWLDLRAKGTQVYVATSKDGGGHWDENRLAYASPSGTVCECCHPSVAYDSRGRLHVMFRNSLEGARDMYLTTSTDGGGTFGAAAKLGTGTWPLKACPMDGGALFPTGDSVRAVWRRGEAMYESGLDGAESVLGPGVQGWGAVGKSGPRFVWSRGRQVVWARPGGEPALLAEQGEDPVVAGNGRGPTIAAWTDSGIKAAILDAP